METVDLLIQHLAPIKKPLHLHEPWFNEKSWVYVKDCLDSGFVSSVGQYVSDFERALEKLTGAKHAIAVVNGTAALHMCFKACDVMENDEVLLPALTFVATANAVKYCGATPHFVDVARDTLAVDPEALDRYLAENTEIKEGQCINKKTGRVIKALCVMHVFGHPADLNSLLSLCERYHLQLVEDAAEGLGSYYKKQHLGTFGKVGALSFNGNKVLTTGGGGAILTNDDPVAAKLRHITTTAKVPHAWDYYHDEVGYNYRMPNLNAALGCAQLETLAYMLSMKRKLAKWYQTILAECAGCEVLTEPPEAESNYWLNAVILKDESDLVPSIEKLHAEGVFVRPIWKLLHTLPMYQDCPRMPLPVSEGVVGRIFNLPSGVQLAIDLF
ncbi:MAG: perosamine synthetase [marine bacterium B5-7]|nr:MAG: perosamine synthetase [marine bacterium B5-7]